MKITFLVGNGFDISLGLKTSYSHFYRWYCNISSNAPHIEQFKANINNELSSNIPEEQRTWADLELGLGKYSKHFSPNNMSEYIECFADVQTQIANYIDEENSKYNTDLLTPKDIENFKNSIHSFYDLSDAENNLISRLILPHNNQISLITFNYSNILDRVIGLLETDVLATWSTSGGPRTCRINKNVLHVNGALAENPILGVDDTSQIENAQLRTDSLVQQILVKNRCVNSLGRLWHTDAERLISESDIFCIYGMSLGKSDTRWWKQLINRLIDNSHAHIIIYWYDPDPIDKNDVVRTIQITENIKRKIMSFVSFSNSTIQGNVKNRIHVKVNTNRILKLPTYSLLESMRLLPAALALKMQ